MNNPLSVNSGAWGCLPQRLPTSGGLWLTSVNPITPTPIRRGSPIAPKGEGRYWALNQSTEFWAHSGCCAYFPSC